MADPLKALAPKGDRKKLYVYGGLAVALLVVLMVRRRSADATQQPADPSSGQLTPVSNPAPTDGGYGGTGVDNGAQLASFENALLDQLPAAIDSSIQAGFANWTPAPASSAGAGDSSTPSGTVDLAATMAGMVAGLSGLINVGTGMAGASNAASKAGPASNNVKTIVHPVVAAHGSTPGEKYTTKENVTRKGQVGELHIYKDHEVFVPRVRTP